MNRYLLIFSFIIFFLIGFFVKSTSVDSDQQTSQELLESKQMESQRFDLAKNKLEKFTEKQMLEYYTLVDEKEKYLKAEEILSKMMIIFLADLGLRLSSKNKDWIKEKRSEEEKPVEKISPKPKVEIIKVDEEERKNEQEDENVVYGYDQEPMELEKNKLTINNKTKKFRQFYDKLGGKVKSMIRHDKDINILSSNKIYKGETKPVNKSLLNYYLGPRKGFFRRGLKSNLSTSYHLKLEKTATAEDFTVKLRFNALGDSYTAIQINDSFKAVHPVAHSNDSGRGPCRTLILKGKNGLQIYLTNIRKSKQIFGRVININRKRPTLGFFLLEKLSE